MPNEGRSKLDSADLKRALRISEKVRRIFEKYEQKEGLNEAGGILLGNVAEDYVEIMDATTPSRFDLRNFFSFVRARIPAQLRINKAWKKSTGTKIYLGEWHTHREVNPSPSMDDRQMIAKAFKETKMEIDFLYLIIVGVNGTYWIGRQTKKGLIKVDDFEIS